MPGVPESPLCKHLCGVHAVHTPHAPTMPGTGPIGEPPAAATGRPQRGGGCVHPRSSPSRDSGGHSGEHNGGSPDSGGLAGVAVGTEGSPGSVQAPPVGGEG